MNSTFQWSHGYDPAPEFDRPVAYFSMEFAIDQAFKIYSGGLGYLAGSHMKSAAALRQNMVGIGILWSQGYYDQERDERGFMRVTYRRHHYSFLEDTGIVVPIELKGNQVWVKAYYLAPHIFNTVPMFFLTTDIEQNDWLARSTTERLYHPNDAARIAQNIILGIGGAKILDELHWTPEVYHMNEAHALPLACHLYEKYGSQEEVAKHLVFTTHTPEQAGNDVRGMDLLDEMGFFNGMEVETAREVMHMTGAQFEYTPAALRMSKIANGVSKLHGHVARQMWQDYPYICPITSITNAQNAQYWQDKILKHAHQNNDRDLLVRRKKDLKRPLFDIVADQTGKLFDENVLTIVWARRFAGYKRAELITRDLDRLLTLLDDPQQPIQIIWAGKPYPEDHHAVQSFNHLVKVTDLHPRMAILTGYELTLSAILKKGSDVWLNTPRRPQEASGTSGMTAAMNASLNFSINDGWIPEFARQGVNSFIVPEADLSASIAEQDTQDYEHIMSMLEDWIIPLYYRHPDRWTDMIFQSMSDVVPAFDSDRMAREYYEVMFAQ